MRTDDGNETKDATAGYYIHLTTKLAQSAKYYLRTAIPQDSEKLLSSTSNSSNMTANLHQNYFEKTQKEHFI